MANLLAFFKNKKIAAIVDILSFPFSLLAAIWLKPISIMIRYLPINKKVFDKIGIFPVRDHYYQPLVNPEKHLKKSLAANRNLPGIDLNIEEQLAILSSFNYNDELLQFPMQKPSGLGYFYKNGSFESGDSEYLYNMIRLVKPSTFIEIGSGFSTLMANSAIVKNNNGCRHICIEPYQAPWISDLPNVEIIRQKLEDTDLSTFGQLKKGDILFIDSSHIIRPQGDVLLEYLEILPQLASGVIIHIHDIFTPKDYLEEFVLKNRYMWNEQYLLEALLTNTKSFKIIAAVNFLKHNHFTHLSAKCPILKMEISREPGSFWLEKI